MLSNNVNIWRFKPSEILQSSDQ